MHIHHANGINDHARDTAPHTAPLHGTRCRYVRSQLLCDLSWCLDSVEAVDPHLPTMTRDAVLRLSAICLIVLASTGVEHW